METKSDILFFTEAALPNRILNQTQPDYTTTQDSSARHLSRNAPALDECVALSRTMLGQCVIAQNQG